MQSALNEKTLEQWITRNVSTSSDHSYDFEIMLQQQIALSIFQDLSRESFVELLSEVLQVQGLTTLVCKGTETNQPDIDILASGGLMGFGDPRICLKINNSVDPIDRLVLDAFNGALEKYHADYGILISVNGFRISFQPEVCREFFKIRFWDMEHVIHEILEHYPKFSQRVQNMLPLQQVWILDNPAD